MAGPIRIKNTQEDRLDDLLQRYRRLEVVIETSPAWPWLFDRLQDRGMLARSVYMVLKEQVDFNHTFKGCASKLMLSGSRSSREHLPEYAQSLG